MAESISHANSNPQQANKVNKDALSNQIKALIFDLDNTLIPTRTGDNKAIRKLADLLENQYSFTKDESTLATQSFLKAFRRYPDNTQTTLDSWRTHLWRDALPNRHKWLAEQIYPKWLHLRYRYLAVTADFVLMLRAFREGGYLLALITNGPSNAQWEKIKKLNLQQYFDCILVSADLPWEKPNPNIFFAACNFLGVQPAECAMIGDKLETDIMGGCLANLGKTFWLPINANDAEDLADVTHPPNYILKQLLDLHKYFPIPHHHGNNELGRRNSGAFLTNSSNLINTSHTRRRTCQVNSATASPAGESDIQLQRHQMQQNCRVNFYYNNHRMHTPAQSNKYRSGNSLPSMECINSEAEENSLDSVCN